jgi:hypothetical protein
MAEPLKRFCKTPFFFRVDKEATVREIRAIQDEIQKNKTMLFIQEETQKNRTMLFMKLSQIINSTTKLVLTTNPTTKKWWLTAEFSDGNKIHLNATNISTLMTKPVSKGT